MSQSSIPNNSKGFDQWTVDGVKKWVASWKVEFDISKSTVSNVISKIELYNISGSVLLYLTKEDLNEFGLSSADVKVMMDRINYLHKHPSGKNSKHKAKKANDNDNAPEIMEENKNNNDNDDNTNTTTFTKGYLTTKGQEIYICLQKGNSYTKMAIDSSCTVDQLKQKYIKQFSKKGKQFSTNGDNIVLLFMGQILNEKQTLDYYKIGCTNVSIIFVAERMSSISKQQKGECSGILFINKDDKSEHILYVDISMTFLQLKQLYKDYLIKQYEKKNMQKQAQKLYSQSISFECSGKTFSDKLLLKDCGVGMTELQYIFVSFNNIKEEEKDSDDNYITKIYKLTPKEHKQITTIKQKFEKSIKAAQFQKTTKTISQTFKATSKYELDQMKSYQAIQDVVKEQTSDHSKKAKEYTKKILNTPVTGKLGSDVNMTLQIISSIFKSAGDECVFYDSRKGIKLKAGDSGCAMHEMFQKDKPFVLRIKTLDGLYGVTNDDIKDDTNKLIEMQSAINNRIEHPTLAHVKNKLSAAMGIHVNRINIIEVFSGSDCFKYTVSDLTFLEKQRIIQQDPTGRLAQQFRQFKELKIHPLLFRPAFDVANFDKRGDKSFVSANGKYQIGPVNMKKEYQQPSGWTRYGLTVLGKYGDDKWLHPFNDAGNWWRAFHGTKNAAVYNVNPADAMA
eukprot:458248_1